MTTSMKAFLGSLLIFASSLSLVAKETNELDTIELEYSMYRVLGGEEAFSDFKAQPVLSWESLCNKRGFEIDGSSLAELRINQQDSIIRVILMGSVLKANDVAFPPLVNDIQKDYRKRLERKKALEKAVQGMDEKIFDLPIEEGTEIKVTVTTPSGEEVDVKSEVQPEDETDELDSDE